MKRNNLLALAILIVFCMAACGAEDGLSPKSEPEHTLWTRACVVAQVNDEVVIVTDSVYHSWSFRDEPGSWEVGDGCSLLLDDNGTPDIYDDIVLRSDFFRLDILSEITYERGGV